MAICPIKGKKTIFFLPLRVKFMEIASFSQGCQINFSNIAREVGISRKIVVSYFEILEDLLKVESILIVEIFLDYMHLKKTIRLQNVFSFTRGNILKNTVKYWLYPYNRHCFHCLHY